MNNILFMKAKTYTIGICLLLFMQMGCKKQPDTVNQQLTTNEHILNFFKSEIEQSVLALDSISTLNSTSDKIEAYKSARHHFKALEPILAFVDQNNYKSLNAPNILQVLEEDATDIKIRTPFGFQVIEEFLHEEPLDTLALHQVVKMTSSRLKLIQGNTAIALKDYHIIWLLRNQVVRIATTGITGFDSPVLAQSLKESQYTYKTLLYVVDVFKDEFSSEAIYNDLKSSFENAIVTLNHDFESFDRFSFIKNHTDNQLKLLVQTQDDWQVTFPFEMALTNNATSLFGENTLNVSYFTDYKSDTLKLKEKAEFGKQLFNDKLLSKNKTMACASCHVSDLAFTDGRKTFDDRQIRNSPTLTYAAYQQSFFMDGRAGSLEGQVVGVAENHDEFNLPMDSLVNRVMHNSEYKTSITTLYNNDRVEYNIRHAIASYVRTLNSFDSKFDKNINGLEHSLTQEEKDGFNLFMGKAVCATCHFPPLFNGTVPPNYTDTELELLGVPENNDTINAIVSKDLGRYNFYKTKEREHFFKTPTVRNIEKTAPYMHNGVYNTLEEVVDFYNRGGGKGIGIQEEYQTLPFDSLDLSESEQASLVAFMKTLTDADFNTRNE
ncbi:cytochrome-c peroxidase [Formosa sp. 4Alg 33]|uniref:cytochrome-c peroxidase n=1 Tax=Formosa sp. 4Alg 33 TaxID=3382189 RepID=UPI003D9C0FF4